MQEVLEDIKGDSPLPTLENPRRMANASLNSQSIVAKDDTTVLYDKNIFRSDANGFFALVLCLYAANPLVRAALTSSAKGIPEKSHIKTMDATLLWGHWTHTNGSFVDPYDGESHLLQHSPL